MSTHADARDRGPDAFPRVATDVPLQLGRQVLELEGARAFLVAVSCASSERCPVDRSVFAPGALGEPSDQGELATLPTSFLRTLTLRRLAEGLFTSGHGESALTILQHVSQHDASAAERAAALSDVAAVAHASGDVESACELLRAALLLYPAHPDALANAHAIEAACAGAARAIPPQRRVAIGVRPAPEWELLAALPQQLDLSRIASHSIAELYVGDLLEAFELSRTELLLAELARVLVPNGRMILELRDAARVAQALTDAGESPSLQLHLLRLLFGPRGERSAAFTEPVLVALLGSAGFVGIERLPASPVRPRHDAHPSHTLELAMHLTARAPA